MQPSERTPGGQPPYNISPTDNRAMSPNEEDRLAHAYLTEAISLFEQALGGASLNELERLRDGLDNTIQDVRNTLPPASLGGLYQAIDEFAHSDRKSEWNIFLACPTGSRGNLAWRILALIKGMALKNADKDPCIQALEKARKVPDEEREPVLKALATLLFKQSEFTFDLTPFIPKLKEFLEKPPFSPTVLSFICCGLRNDCPTSKAEEELIDLLLKVFFQDASNLRYIHHFDGIKDNPISSQKIHRSAERLMISMGSPYSVDYARLMLRMQLNPVFSTLMKHWLFSPYLKTEADRLLQELSQRRQWKLMGEALKHCSDASFLKYIIFQATSVLDENVLQRFFKIGVSLVDHPDWHKKFFEGRIIPYLIAVREGYMSEEELETFKFWICKHPKPIDLVGDFDLFPDLPQIWSCISSDFSIEAKSLNHFDSLINSFIVLIQDWPELPLPPQITVPTINFENLTLETQVICARHFPRVITMPLLNPQQILKRLKASERVNDFRNALLLLYLNRQRSDFIVAIRNNLFCFEGAIVLPQNENGMVVLLQQLEILYEAFKEMQQMPRAFTEIEFCSKILEQASIFLGNCKSKKLLTYRYVLILGKFAEKIPTVVSSLHELKISLAHGVHAVRNLEEREALLAAVYAIHKANPKLLSLDPLEDLFKEAQNNSDRFFGRQLDFIQPRLNLARQLLDRQRTGKLAPSLNLGQRKVKWQPS